MPGLLAGADQVAYLDVGDTIRQTHGYAKQGVGYGYTGVKGLNVQGRDPLHTDRGSGAGRYPAAQGQQFLGARHTAVDR